MLRLLSRVIFSFAASPFPQASLLSSEPLFGFVRVVPTITFLIKIKACKWLVRSFYHSPTVIVSVITWPVSYFLNEKHVACMLQYRLCIRRVRAPARPSPFTPPTPPQSNDRMIALGTICRILSLINEAKATTKGSINPYSNRSNETFSYMTTYRNKANYTHNKVQIIQHTLSSYQRE
jgi:hypothetical protein